MIFAYRPSRYRGGRRVVEGGAFVWVWTGVGSSASAPAQLVNQIRWWLQMSNSFYSKYETITPSDGTDFASGMCHAIYVGGAGVLAVVQQDGTVVNFTAVAGEILPVRAKRVNTTNTTATLMNALYQL